VDIHTSAFVLVGYQNDYFSPQGALRSAIEDSELVTGTLQNTVRLIERLDATPLLMVTTPIVFTEDYSELRDPIGILKTIQDVRAFQAGASGAATVPELARFGDRLVEVPGKRGLNAFSNTQLDEILQSHGVRDVVIGGVVASLCIDSTGRAALERGYRVTFLADCISARTRLEQRFYVSEIYPLYARVLSSQQWLEELTL
jgi:nicotinamidase-related amidase